MCFGQEGKGKIHGQIFFLLGNNDQYGRDDIFGE